MIFDWYAASFRTNAPHESVLADLGLVLDATPIATGRGLHGYTDGWEFRRPEGIVARALSGGSNQFVHAWASGADTVPFVDVVREWWPEEHTVSRVDACEDFTGEGCWDGLLAACVAEAEGRRLSINQAGDWMRDGQAGRTLYLGAKSSPVRARLYEKGKQLRGDGVKDAPLDWVRLELQVRPEHQAKWTLAKATPEQTWGASKWSQALAERALDFDTDRIDGRVWHEPDDARALRYLIRQYGPLLTRLRAQKRSWEVVGELLGNMLEPVA